MTKAVAPAPCGIFRKSKRSFCGLCTHHLEAQRDLNVALGGLPMRSRQHGQSDDETEEDDDEDDVGAKGTDHIDQTEQSHEQREVPEARVEARGAVVRGGRVVEGNERGGEGQEEST